jgi:hypothetical protein
MFARAMLLGILAAACFVPVALLGAAGPVLSDLGGPMSEDSPLPAIIGYGRLIFLLAGGGLLLGCIILAVPAFNAHKAGLLGKAAAVLAGAAVALPLLGLAGVRLGLPFPISSSALLMLGGSLSFFALERLADNRGGGFGAVTMNTRPAAIILLVAGILTEGAAAVGFTGGGGGGDGRPRVYRTRFGGTRTFSGRGIDLPPGITSAVFALAACGLLLNCVFVLRSFRRAAEKDGGLATEYGPRENIPDIDTRPWNPQQASDARPDHLRRGDDPPLAP